MTNESWLAPVIAGIGQVANKDPDRIVHPVELLAEAAELALKDAGIAAHRVGGVMATPLSTFSSDDASQLLAGRLGLAPGIRQVSSYSGAAPQRLIAAACEAIRQGDADVIVVVGGIADASVRRATQRGLEPPAPPTARWSQGTRAPKHDRVERGRHEYYSAVPEVAAGAGMPNAYFALVESAMAAGWSPAEHRAALGALLAPFTDVAARRPELAWFPSVRSPADLSEPTLENRLVAEPYTKLMCSFPTVDLAAALVIARSAVGGRPAVRPLTLVSGREAHPPSGRPVYHRSVALQQVVDTAMSLSRIGLEDIAQFDLYSCFPAAVQLLAGALGLDRDDPRSLTATGGLPYFGGPGASYSLHGVACLVEGLRAHPGTVGAALSLGGMMSDFSMGLYGVHEGACELRDIGEISTAAVEMTTSAAGAAIVEAATVLHDRERGPVAAPVVVRLPDGRRAGAVAGDPALPAELAGAPSLVGRQVELRTSEGGLVTYITT